MRRGVLVVLAVLAVSGAALAAKIGAFQVETSSAATQVPSSSAGGSSNALARADHGHGCAVASASQAGCLSTAGWATLAGQVDSVTAAAPVVSSGGQTPQISMPAASWSQDGYLSVAWFTSLASRLASVVPRTDWDRGGTPHNWVYSHPDKTGVFAEPTYPGSTTVEVGLQDCATTGEYLRRISTVDVIDEYNSGLWKDWVCDSGEPTRITSGLQTEPGPNGVSRPTLRKDCEDRSVLVTLPDGDNTEWHCAQLSPWGEVVPTFSSGEITFECSAATASVPGCLQPTDYQRFNAAALNFGTPTNNAVLVGTGSGWMRTTIPSCSGSSGILRYNNSTRTFSCVSNGSWVWPTAPGTMRYRKTADGTVSLRGVGIPTAGTALFTLPSDHRPSVGLFFVSSTGPTETPSACTVTIMSSGDVIPRDGCLSTGVSLDGIMFNPD